MERIMEEVYDDVMLMILLMRMLSRSTEVTRASKKREGGWKAVTEREYLNKRVELFGIREEKDAR